MLPLLKQIEKIRIKILQIFLLILEPNMEKNLKDTQIFLAEN